MGDGRLNREELEHAIYKLDEAVEKLVEINNETETELIPEGVLENIQCVIARLENEYAYAESSTEEEDSYEEDS